jgi:hypothetical protein
MREGSVVTVHTLSLSFATNGCCAMIAGSPYNGIHTATAIRTAVAESGTNP